MRRPKAVAGADAHVVASVDLEVRDQVAWVSISNPGKRNAFTWQMYAELGGIADELNNRDDVLAAVFRGNETDGFAAGTDIRQFTDFSTGTDGIHYEERLGRIFAKLQALRVPAIALVQGAAVGAGLAVAASCDVIIAERGAVFGAPIARSLGNCLSAQVVARLRSRMGPAPAIAMLLTSSLLSAEELTASGFVHRLTDPGGLDDAAEDLLRRIRTSAPLTLRALKEINRRLEAADAVPEIDDLLDLCYGSRDFQEGVRAFLDRRRPNWKGQ